MSALVKGLETCSQKAGAVFVFYLAPRISTPPAKVMGFDFRDMFDGAGADATGSTGFEHITMPDPLEARREWLVLDMIVEPICVLFLCDRCSSGVIGWVDPTDEEVAGFEELKYTPWPIGEISRVRIGRPEMVAG